MKAHVRDVEHLEEVIDRFTPYGQTTTSVMQTSPVPAAGRRGRPDQAPDRDRREQDHHDDAQALDGDDERRVRARADRGGEHGVEAARRRRQVGVGQRRPMVVAFKMMASPKQATSSTRMLTSTGTSSAAGLAHRRPS